MSAHPILSEYARTDPVLPGDIPVAWAELPPRAPMQLRTPESAIYAVRADCAKTAPLTLVPEVAKTTMSDTVTQIEASAEKLGVRFEGTSDVLRVQLTGADDSAVARTMLARELYDLLGDELRTEVVEVTYNGTSLRHEIADAATRPKVVYAV